jgi:hypothetical protein
VERGDYGSRRRDSHWAHQETFRRGTVDVVDADVDDLGAVERSVLNAEAR